MRPPASALSYYLRLTLSTPFILLAMLLQTAWSLWWEAVSCARLIYRDELRPMYASYFELWTVKACRRATSLARGSGMWSRQG